MGLEEREAEAKEWEFGVEEERGDWVCTSDLVWTSNLTKSLGWSLK